MAHAHVLSKAHPSPESTLMERIALKIWVKHPDPWEIFFFSKGDNLMVESHNRMSYNFRKGSKGS